MLCLGMKKVKQRTTTDGFTKGKKPKEEVADATTDEAGTLPTLPEKQWVMVEVQDDKGNVHMEERFYMPGGGFIKKPKGRAGPGRPKIRKIPELEVLLGDILSEEKNGIPAAKLILAALRKKAIAGDVRAAELLLDRAYGKSKQEINVKKTETQYIMIAGQKIEF